MSFSTNLIRLRDLNGWTQEELAEKIGVSRSTIAKWEVGRGRPMISNLLALSDVFGVTVDSLLRGEEKPEC